uniref:Uncharacterized protein n=1 Tax=Salix viminalis TaxID=40686 RepID=A0A6N2NHQ5_SALVM
MWWKDLRATLSQRINVEGIGLSASVIVKDHHLILPHVLVPDIRYIDWGELQRRGFKGVVFDKDNTITVPYSLTLWGPLVASIEKCKSVFGNDIAVFSNSAGLFEYDHDGSKARALEEAVGIKVIRHRVKKPAGTAEEIEKHFGCKSSQLVMVGDRPFTDIVYGNQNGFLTVLTEPLSLAEEPFIVRQVRKLEMSLMNYWLKRGIKPISHDLLPDAMECENFGTKSCNYQQFSGSHTPSHGTTPSHGSGGSSGGTPSHSTPSTPSGGSYNPTPSTPSGGSYNPTPSTPSGGNCGTPPSVPTPSTPSNPPRGGGYYPTPPTTVGSRPPTPVIVSPPSTPSITPGTPFTPTPPFIPDPNSPFSCNYWRTHPAIIWGVLGWWGTTGNAFGVSSLPGFGSSMTVQQALSNTRTDGYGTLYREGTASLLNSMVSNKFHFTTRQVRENFISALVSNKAAGAQGQLFKLANEGRLKPRA